MHGLYYTDVQNMQQNNRLNHYTKQQKSIFLALTTIGGITRLKTVEWKRKEKYFEGWRKRHPSHFDNSMPSS